MSSTCLGVVGCDVGVAGGEIFLCDGGGGAVSLATSWSMCWTTLVTRVGHKFVMVHA